MLTVAVIGATGYAGAELVRLLCNHPRVTRLAVGSTSKAGSSLLDLYPNLAGPRCRESELMLMPPEEAIAGADVVFSAQPSGCAEELAAKVAAGAAPQPLFIDLSADFRFGTDSATYEKWYGKKQTHPELHAASVYGLPELNRAQIRGARIIGNPGCYPTASALGLFPALKMGLTAPSVIIIDAQSGVSGAGREPTAANEYCAAADNISPYKIGSHRHTPEINAVLSKMAGRPVEAIFTPHLAPMGRGIVATIYFPLAQNTSAEELRAAYAEFYRNEPFVRILPAGATAGNRFVKYSNYCDISLHLAYSGADAGLAGGGHTAIVVSAIDNMVKGAAGQAIQNMNIALGFEETAGLETLAPAF